MRISSSLGSKTETAKSRVDCNDLLTLSSIETYFQSQNFPTPKNLTQKIVNKLPNNSNLNPKKVNINKWEKKKERTATKKLLRTDPLPKIYCSLFLGIFWRVAVGANFWNFLESKNLGFLESEKIEVRKFTVFGSRKN
jgi:hypothetical protein